MLILCLLFGAMVGLSLGLTGAGGAILAVPLLVYGLSVAPNAAVPISLLAVGVGAFVGFIQRLQKKEVVFSTGLLIAGGGFVGAPLGAWLGERISGPLLMALFAVLLLTSGTRMWLATQDDSTGRNQGCGVGALSARCTVGLAGLGLFTGMLSSLFGVGGGFILVPALVVFNGMEMHRATATSLMVIALVSATALGTLLFRGQTVDMAIALPFMGGGLVGMVTATRLAHRLPQKGLQKTFAALLVLIALYTLYSTVFH